MADAARDPRHPVEIRRAVRDWRVRERAARTKPLSDKVVHPRVLVAVTPRIKPKGRLKI